MITMMYEGRRSLKSHYFSNQLLTEWLIFCIFHLIYWNMGKSLSGRNKIWGKMIYEPSNFSLTGIGIFPHIIMVDEISPLTVRFFLPGTEVKS